MDLRIIQIKLCLKDQFWPAGFLLHLESDQSRSWTFQGLFTKSGGICKLIEAIPFSGGSRGEARGASLPPVIFRPNWGPKGRKKFEAAPPPLSQGLDGLDDCPLPPPPSLRPFSEGLYPPLAFHSRGEILRNLHITKDCFYPSEV